MSFSRLNLRDKPFFQQAIFLLLLICGGMLVFLFISALLPIFFPDYGTSIDQQLESIGLTKAIQIISQILVFMLPALAFAFFMTGNAAGYLNLKKAPDLRQIMLAIVITLTAGIFIQWLVEVNEMIQFPESLAGFEQKLNDIQEKSEQLMEAFLSVKTIPGLLVLLFMIGVVPAVSEEFLFRGVIQRLLTDNRSMAFIPILVTAISFALIHFQFYNFLAITFMGVVLGYLYHLSQNLWVPVIAHMVNNSLQVLLVYLHRINMVETDIEQLDGLPIWLTLVSGLLLIYFFNLFRKVSIYKG